SRPTPSNLRPDSSDINQECRLLMNVNAASLKTDIRIFYSSEESANLADQLGATHYSYGFAARKFLEAFRALGRTPQKLALPPYYGGRGLAELIGEGDTKPIHLIFRSSENIRTVT